MAYSVDWIAKEITIPVGDLTLVSGTHYSLSMSDFLIEIRRLESAFDDGLWAPQILDHTNTKVDFAGTDYAAFDEVINSYVIIMGVGPTRVDVTGSNNNIVDVLSPTGISVVPSNSAGLVNSADLKATTFMGRVGLGIHLAPTSGTDSSLYPVGNASRPAKTEANLGDIYLTRPYRNVYLKEAITITGDHSAEKHAWYGDNPNDAVATLDNACDVTGNSFEFVYINGKLDADNILERCVVGSITNANGFIYSSTLIGPIVASANLTIEVCFPAPGVDVVTVDFNSLTIDIKITGSHGVQYLVKNMVTGSKIEISGSGGSAELDSTCTGGGLKAYGAIEINHSAASLDTIDDGTLFTRVNDQWQFKGADPDNSITRGGDQVTTETITVDGKTITITPTTISRS